MKERAEVGELQRFFLSCVETVSSEIEKRNASMEPRDSTRKLPYERFKRTDKLRVMELLLENEVILQLVY